ncbi:cytochrome P450 6k1-like [Homalodisca vitripennis]|uniref:cytochrome P450 6k1-like n=1 Tax=Homalodisca vitripennis TaxID=197043 RepID=UPI001EEBDAF1|nr:cytochrome P450 6k1-like [Homalodisca vitripennis]
MGTVLLILLGILILVYLWLKRHYNYWARQGIPQPPPVFGFGCFLDVILMRDIPGLIYDKMYKDYSGHDAVGLYQFFTPELLLRSPELIKRVMASDFSSFHDNLVTVSERLDPHFAKDPFMAKGEEWKRYRAKLVPTVTSTRMKEIYPLMKDVTNRLDAYLEGSESKIFDAKELATLFTMDNVSSTVFGINSNCFSDPEATFRKLGNLQMKEQLKFRWQTIIVLFLPRLRNLLGLRFVPTVVNNFVESIVQDVIDFRSKNGVVRNDLFQYFMKKEPGNKLEDIMSYAMTFFIEGFETAAMTASAAIYELALNPDVQVTLHEEILEAFGDEGNIDVDVAYNLPYLDKVVQESLRKYPIMYVYDRECTKAINFDVDGKSVEIPVGCSVVIPVYSIHHDPQYYPDPEVFDPERFSKENKAQRPAYTYMPFGEGPRICPGLRFGLTQVKLLLTYLVHKYKIQRCDKTPEKLTLSASPVLVSPNEQQWIRLEKRW